MNKLLYLFAFVWMSTQAYSQTLPMDFEGGPGSVSFVDFDGGTATVIANPQMSGDNTSANVGQLVRNGGQIWAGSKVTLASALDFSVMNAISMKFYTDAPVGTLVKFKLEGAGDTERDATTTVSGAWETLTWNFNGETAPYTDVVFLFDFGNVGDGTSSSTFLFDDVTQYTEVAVLDQIDHPVDFEGTTTDYTMTDFGGNVSQLVVDPADASNTAMRVIKSGGAETWAGTTIGMGTGFATDLPFSATDTKMSVRVYSPTVGTPIRLKVENSADAGQTCETEALTTVSGAWEILEFDFASEAPGTQTLAFGLTNSWIYNKASIFFNFGTDGATAGEQTYYFDDVEFVPGDGSLAQIDHPVDFEGSTTDYTMTDFGGNASTLVVDPANAANMAMQVVKSGTAELWAGTTMGDASGSGFATPLPFTATDTKMTVRVYSPTMGTPIRLKVENSGDAGQTCETEALTTVAGAWEELEFDFSNEAAGTQTLAFGLSNSWVFDKASIFFNFGTTGAAAGEQTYYFDDVEFLPSTGGGLDQIDHPTDFEGSTTDYTVTDFGGNASSLVVDPADASNMVMQTIKTGAAELWAGTTIGLPTGFATALPFTASDTKMSVRVYSPAAGLPIRLKVENSLDAGQTCETETLTTMAGAWEVLEFDFTNEVAATQTLAFGLANSWVFDKASIFFNFGTTGATAGEQTYYFDDVEFVPGGGGGLDQIDHPTDFEGGTTDYTVSDFGGNASSLVVDPEDASNMVIQTIKSGTAELWAGTTIGTATGFATALPFTSTDTKMTVRVWSPAAGTPVRLKVENFADAAQTCETEVLTTVSGAWEVMEFDFSAEAAGTQPLSVGLTNGWVFNKASLFFNFGTTGADAGEQTYYFDDVMFTPYVPVMGCTDPAYLEFDPYADVEDGSCATIRVMGCIYEDADNYDPAANDDDESCIFSNNCPGDFDGNLAITAFDLSQFLNVFGTNCIN